jgi:hypothetical protein
MVELRFCPQHYGNRPIAEFVGKKGGLVNWCESCRNIYRNGGAALTRRARIDQLSSSNVLWVPKSGDRKLGGIPATYSAGSTCPDACALKDNGCYAEFGKLQFHWRRVPERGLEWATFLAQVSALPPGQLWRHNVAGDLPGLNDQLGTQALLQLVLANAGRRGFTFTHKPLRTIQEKAAIGVANRRGFTINLSADTLEQADEKAALGIGPVVVTVPSDARAGLRTPAGRHVVLCPAETHGLTCAACQLCAQPQRKAIVGFRAHGQWKARIDGRLRLPVLQERVSA